MDNIFTSVITIILVENYVLVKFLGICPFLGVSKKTDTALAMGMAVTFVMGLASAITYFVQRLLLHFEIEYLQTIAFILVIASLVQLVEIILKRYIPSLHKSLGIYLPLITTNCAVLGVTINNINDGYGFALSMVSSFACGLGFLLAMVLFAGVRSRIEDANPPESFRGLPITLVSAAIVALSFMGFTGLAENVIAAIFGK